jgi:hypothetical protein
MEGIMFKSRKVEDQTIRSLSDAEIEVVSGGVVEGGCIPGRPTIKPTEYTGWTFKDIWAPWTIGH